MRISTVIFLFILSACSSEPPGSRLGDLGDGERGGKASSGKAPPPDDGASTELGGGGESSPPLDGDAGDPSPPPPPPPSPDPSTTPDAGAAAVVIGARCEPADVKEQTGKDVPFTSTACGRIDFAIDEDFFVFDVKAPKALTLRVGATGDAVARLTTADGKVIAVSNGGVGSVAAGVGPALIRVRSKLGAIQEYRIVVE